MNELLLAFGRGIVKMLISLFVGAGVGLMTLGLCVKSSDDLWRGSGPPPAMFLAVGAGLLSSAGLMLGLFLIPRKAKPPLSLKGEPVDV